MHKVVHLIASPRNISTALMYSFARREGMRVVDEPFYACYLERTGLPHPGFDEILAAQRTDPSEVTEGLADMAGKSDLFIKDMSHHLSGMELEFLLDHEIVLLIRDPALQIASYSSVIDRPQLRDIGIGEQEHIRQWLEKAGKQVTVVDAGELLKAPEAVLRKLCGSLSLEFTPAMLHWDPGPISEDGIWAKYWYLNVHRSTGFQAPPKKKIELEGHLAELYERALPYYRQLYDLAIKAPAG